MPSARILVISGSMGAGKTTVMGEASDLLSLRQTVHAAFDLDALGVVQLPEPQSRALHYRNLAALYGNCREAGVECFLIAAAIENQEVLADLTRVFRDATITVCRLIASLETMAARLEVREVGMMRTHYLGRSVVLDSVLDVAGVEHFRIGNEGRGVTEVAQEMLVKAGWTTAR